MVEGARFCTRPCVVEYAVRAKQTTDLVVEALGGSVDIQWHPDLYLSTPATMQAKVAEVPSSVSKVLLVAHNPGLEELVQWVIGGHESFPTAAVACFECDSEDWSAVHELNRWKLRKLFDPKRCRAVALLHLSSGESRGTQWRGRYPSIGAAASIDCCSASQSSRLTLRKRRETSRAERPLPVDRRCGV